MAKDIKGKNKTAVKIVDTRVEENGAKKTLYPV